MWGHRFSVITWFGERPHPTCWQFYLGYFAKYSWMIKKTSFITLHCNYVRENLQWHFVGWRWDYIKNITQSFLKNLYLGWENGHSNPVILSSVKPKALWPANSYLLSRWRSSTRDCIESITLAKEGFFGYCLFFRQKGKLLGKINSLSGFATKALEGKDKLSLQGQEEKSLYL